MGGDRGGGEGYAGWGRVQVSETIVVRGFVRVNKVVFVRQPDRPVKEVVRFDRGVVDLVGLTPVAAA